MGRAPLLLPLAALVCGIVVAPFAGNNAFLWALFPLIAGGMAFAMKRHVLGSFLIYSALGILTSVMHRPNQCAAYGKHVMRGEIVTVTEAGTSGLNAIVRVNSLDSTPVPEYLMRVHLLSERPCVTAGQDIEFKADVRPLPEVPAIPDIVDFSADLRRRGVTAYADVAGDDVRIVGNTPGITAWFKRLNADLQIELMECNLSADAINMLSAMLLGNGEMLQPDRRELYSSAGLAHLLALSGMHVGIIAMLITCALWPLYVGRHNRTRMALTIVALWAYALLTGLSPSVTRAVIMTTVYFLGRMIERPAVSLNSLCLAAILILLFNPSDIASVGFQLSFAAVAGIIIFYPLINRVDYRNHAWLYRLVSYPALSLSAMILTGIVAAFHFHSYPLLFLFANLLVAPLVPLFVSGGALVLLLHLAGVDFMLLCQATDFLASAIDFIATQTGALPWSTLNRIYLPAWITAMLVASLLLVVAGIHRRRLSVALAGVIFICGGVGASLIGAQRNYPPGEMYVIENHRHTSLIMRNGDRCLMFTDALTAADRLESHRHNSRMLADYLALRGVDSLELVPADRLPFIVENGDTFVVELDSCRSPATVAYRRL